MNNREAKRKRKEYQKIAKKMARGKAGRQIFSLARKRDILGIVLILENIILIILFLIFILPRI